MYLLSNIFLVTPTSLKVSYQAELSELSAVILAVQIMYLLNIMMKKLLITVWRAGEMYVVLTRIGLYRFHNMFLIHIFW